MLQCLILEDDIESKKAVDKALTFLINMQLPNGSWDGGFFPIPNTRYKKKEYLLTTSLIIKALSILEKMRDK